MASTEKTIRNRCAYRPCFSQTDKSTSSFSFPKDPQRYMKLGNVEMFGMLIHVICLLGLLFGSKLVTGMTYVIETYIYCIKTIVCAINILKRNISLVVQLVNVYLSKLFLQSSCICQPTHEGTQINVTAAIPTPACVQGSIDSLEVPIKIETVPLTSTTSSQSVAGPSKNQAETLMDILSGPSTSITSSLRIAGLSENPVEVSMETLSVPSTSMTFCVAGPSEQSEEIGVTVPSPLCSTSTGTQAPYTLSSGTPRKQQLRKKLRALRKRIIMPQPKN